MRTNSLRTWSIWTAQIALAALFLFAGVMKFVMSAEALSANSTLPVAFIRFIGACEFLGGLGLVLPGAFRIRRELTPIAAAGLVIIMSGAVGTTMEQFGASAAIFPGAIGILCLVIAYARRDWTAPTSVQPRVSRQARALAQPSHI